jgi:hypothetical protein
MGSAKTTILLELQLIGSIFLVFLGRIVSSLALPTGKDHFITHIPIAT